MDQRARVDATTHGYGSTLKIVPPVNIPIPTKTGSKMGGAPTPKWDSMGVDVFRQKTLDVPPEQERSLCTPAGRCSRLGENPCQAVDPDIRIWQAFNHESALSPGVRSFCFLWLGDCL